MSAGESPVLFHSKDGPVRRADIEASLRASGITSGDLLLVHSDVGSFGKIGDLRDRDLFLQAILEAFTAVIGPRGTLIVPTFTYSFCKNEVFDSRNSKSTVGIFSEFVRTRPGAIRSDDALFSHAGIGEKSRSLLESVGPVCFGPDSFFDRFYRQGGKIVNFGKFFDITFIHYIERAFGVDYRMDKTFGGSWVSKDGARSEKTFVFYVRKLKEHGMDVTYEMPKLGAELKRRNLLKATALGDSEVLCSRAQDCFEVGIEMLERNPYAFLKRDPRLPESV